MAKKIALISDSRCSHSIYVPVLDSIKNSSDFDYQYIITGMHLLEKFGKTINEIIEQGYVVAHTFKVSSDEDSRLNQVRNISQCIDGLSEIFSKDPPDFILVQGDRGISLAAAIVGVHLRIPTLHMHGGEVSKTVDDPVRHAISKLVHAHLASTEESAKRLIKMGEEKFRVHIVGATGIENIKNINLSSEEDILNKYGLSTDKKPLVVLQHPVSGEEKLAGEQMRITLNAVKIFDMPTLIIYPNSDAGNQEIINVIKEFTTINNNFRAYKNIPYLDYICLLKNSSCLIGNSSGGILEAPSLGLPVVNVGTRQEGRERAHNVIDAEYNKESIINGIKRSLYDLEYINRVKRCETPYDPYGKADASESILKIIRNLVINQSFLDKTITY